MIALIDFNENEEASRKNASVTPETARYKDIDVRTIQYKHKYPISTTIATVDSLCNVTSYKGCSILRNIHLLKH